MRFAAHPARPIDAIYFLVLVSGQAGSE